MDAQAEIVAHATSAAHRIQCPLCVGLSGAAFAAHWSKVLHVLPQILLASLDWLKQNPHNHCTLANTKSLFCQTRNNYSLHVSVFYISCHHMGGWQGFSKCSLACVIGRKMTK